MISVSEAARELGISPARVRKMISDGVLPAKKVGRAWLLEEKDVARRLLDRPKAGRPTSARTQERDAQDGFPESDAAYEDDMRELYLSCKEAFRFRPSPHLVAHASSAEEAAFYMTVADFFLQQKQRELVKAGVF